MADEAKFIGELTAGSAMAGTEYFPAEQGATPATVKISAGQIRDWCQNFTNLTAETGIADGDLVAIYDISANAGAGALRKMTKANFVAGLGSNLTLQEVDGNPSVSAVGTIKFSQATGFVLTDETGGVVRVEISALPDSALATISTAGKVADSALSSNVTLGGNSFTGTGNIVRAASPALSGTPTAPTAAAATNTTQIATTAFVRTEVANLVASAPAALDTLNELSTALGNDPNFATTITNSLAGKASTALSNLASVAINTDLIGAVAGGLGIRGGSAANDDLILEGTTHATRTTSYVIIQPNGGLAGVGGTPTEAFHVQGGGFKVSGQVSSNFATGTYLDYFAAENKTRILSFGPNTTTRGQITFYHASSNNSLGQDLLIMTAAGKIGIAEGTPGSTFAVRGGMAIGSSTTYSQATATSGHLIIETALGVGTPTPGTLCELRGADAGVQFIGLKMNGNANPAGTGIMFTDGFNYNFAIGTENNSTGDFIFWSGRHLGAAGTEVMRVKQAGDVQFADACDLIVGTTTGSKIATATGQKLGFWGATPVVQQVLATGAGATVDNVITLLQTLGLCKQS